MATNEDRKLRLVTDDDCLWVDITLSRIPTWAVASIFDVNVISTHVVLKEETMFSEFLLGFQDKDGEESQEGAGNAPRATSKFNLMDVASSVMSSMKEDVDDLVTSFRNTNWTNEILSFGKTVQDETSEAMKSLEHLTASERVRSVRQQLGTGIQRLAVGTKDLFDQAVGTIEAELSTRGAGKTEEQDGLSGVKYSRLELEVMSMQRDSNTYCEEPTDIDDFTKWKESFFLETKAQDIQQLLTDNAFMAELHKHIVPGMVPHDIFWTRYFYRLHKLREKHDQRQQLAERTLRMHEEEEQELHWDDEPIDTSTVQEAAVETPVTDITKEAPVKTSEDKPVKKEHDPSDPDESEWTFVDSIPTVPVTEEPKGAGTSKETDQKDDSDEEVDEDWGEWD